MPLPGPAFPNKLRIYNFFHGNIWPISTKSFFLKKSFIQSHFGSILCLYFFFPLLVLFLAFGDSGREESGHSHS